MSRKVLVIDTSILCIWLSIPGFQTCGPDHDRWDKPRVDAFLEGQRTEGATLVLPLASIIETGNHIAQSAGNRFDLALKLCEVLGHAVEGTAPYAAFSEQSVLWSPEQLRKLAGEWPSLAARALSLADTTIRDVAHFYAGRGFHVEVLTGDEGLKALSPPPAPPVVPRRNRSRL